MSRPSDSERKRILQLERNAQGEILGVRRLGSGAEASSLPPEVRTSMPPSAGDATIVDPRGPGQFGHSAPAPAPDENTNPEMQRVTSPDALEALRPPGRQGRKYISLEATITTPTGELVPARTRKVSSRGLFLLPKSFRVPLKQHTEVAIQLLGEKRTVTFRAVIANAAGRAGVGLEIRGISAKQRLELDLLIFETKPDARAADAERAAQARSKNATALRSRKGLPTLEANEDDEAETLFATSSGMHGMLPKKSYVATAAVAALVLLLGATLALVARRTVTGTVAAPIDSATHAQMVALSLNATPSEATFRIDDGPALPNPYVGQLPRDVHAHMIRTSAPGYSDNVRRISFGADLTLHITLQTPGWEAPSATH